VGIFMNLASTAILKTIAPGAAITTHNHPLPLTYNENRASVTIQGNTAASYIMIAFCFLPASYGKRLFTVIYLYSIRLVDYGLGG
jgi:hypothetical protein